MDRKVTEAVIERIKSLQTAEGTITPEVVVEDAKNPDSPLHGLFDWNLETAAHKFWLDQARTLIKSVQVKITNETFTVKVPMFLRDPNQPSKEQGYVSVLTLQKNPAQARDTMRAEFARVESALERARSVAGAL